LTPKRNLTQTQTHPRNNRQSTGFHAARAEKKKNIFGDFFGFTGRASLDYFVISGGTSQ
jgi:hypothetical protein